MIYGFEVQDYRFIGSIGKKELSNDVDIAVDGDINEVVEILKMNEYDYVVRKGLNQVSVGWPFKNQIVQVDLMFGSNLDWLEYIYYSPNLLKHESKYKGVYRNLLLSALIITESRKVIDEFNLEQNILRLDSGLFWVHKRFNNKKTKSEIIEEKFITNEPLRMLEILRLNGLCLTFEQLHCQIKERCLYDEIIAKFQMYCQQSKLEFQL